MALGAGAYASVVTQDVVPAAKAGAASGTVLTVLIGLGGVAIAVASSVVAGAGGDAAELALHIDRALLFFGALCVVAAPFVIVLGRRFESPLSQPSTVDPSRTTRNVRA